MSAPSIFIEKLRHYRFLLQSEAAFRARHPDAVLAQGVLLYGQERISAGRRLYVDRYAMLNTGTINDERGFIRLGDRVEIGPHVVIWGAGGVTIGDKVHVGAHACMTAHEARLDSRSENPFAPMRFKFSEVVVEDHVLIFSGAQIVLGVRVGHHSMIAAGAVVTDDIPPYSLAAGCPARVVRRRVPKGELGESRRSTG